MPENSSARTRRHYDEAFRRHALELVDQGRSVTAVARELGVNPVSIYEWRRKARPPVDLLGAQPRTVDALTEENKRLREALQRSQMREEILKKSLGIFAEPPAKSSPNWRR